MKSRLEPLDPFIFRLQEEFGGSWDYSRVRRAVRERDRQWERMLAELYRQYAKERKG